MNEGAPRIRFRGLVAAATSFRERLAAGIPPAERETFLASAQKIVGDIADSCRRLGGGPDAIPRPSREALEYLTGIAATSPEQLPLPREGGAAPKRICVRNVVRDLDDCVRTLAMPDLDAGRLDAVFAGVRYSADGIEAVCRDAGGSPGAMPARSASAFAMLRWLSGRENFDRYVAQVDLTRIPLERASRAIWPGSTREVRVHFLPGRTLWRGRTGAQTHTWQLAPGFLNAGPDDLELLARAIANRGGARDVPFVESSDFAELEQELEGFLLADRHTPRGRAYDLDELFARLNASCFGGQLERPHLTWGASATRTQFGCYDRVRDLVTLSPELDDPRLPAYVPAFVLYHELLHKKHGFARSGSRRLVHTEAFMDDERRFADRERAKEHLDAIARGRCRNGPAVVATAAAPAPPTTAPLEAAPPAVLRLVEQNCGAAPVRTATARVGRNAPCPCGSGKKYKMCCGRRR